MCFRSDRLQPGRGFRAGDDLTPMLLQARFRKPASVDGAGIIIQAVFLGEFCTRELGAVVSNEVTDGEEIFILGSLRIVTPSS